MSVVEVVVVLVGVVYRGGERGAIDEAGGGATCSNCNTL